ncbi:MAG: hypothetical protein CMG64_00015 [Candidatus Marinimicrobia bacterium]|nr:hypothetical protein [Candidatus Neomarinimicrobiota bacterium]|tara:strand:+ start:2675 stop:3625 length:951 start_codon:yes stop_codon:yes gene_type:complete
MFFQNFLLKYKSSSLRIVYYHIVSNKNPDYYFKNKAIDISSFMDQINFFKKNFNIIKLSEALKLSKENKSLDKKMVITFDDGFRENYDIIAPILLKEKIPATFFFITDCIDNKNLMWRNKILLFDIYKKNNFVKIIKNVADEYNIKYTTDSILDWSYKFWPMKFKDDIANRIWELVMPFNLEEYLEKNSPYCSTKQIYELFESGFEIGSHSHTHPIFNKLNYDDFSYEIINSSNILSRIINKKVSFFSYPFGSRASNELEKKFIKLNSDNWIFLGTRNKLNNFSYNYNFWERDSVEYNNLIMKFRFLLLPTIRSIV